jgi:hypothetical protein
MLQEFLPERQPQETLGTGTSVCFMCDDALAALWAAAVLALPPLTNGSEFLPSSRMNCH